MLTKTNTYRDTKPPKDRPGLLKVLLLSLLIIALIIPQLGCQSKVENYQGYSKMSYCLDTICTITIYAMSDEDGTLAAMSEDDQKTAILQLITDAFLEADRYENILSKTIEGSDVYEINHAGGQPVEVSDTTIEVLKLGIEYGQLSEGAFDITIGKATDLWDFRNVDENHESENELPSGEELTEAISHVDYTKIQIEGNLVTLADPEMEIDLGGIAKGYITSRVSEYLQEAGVISAVLDFGGNIVTLGGKTQSLLSSEMTDFSIGITDPQSEISSLFGYFTCSDKTVVTSGTYERYVVKDGVTYHHILDVETGYPVDTDVLSVTIIADRSKGAEADCISTTCLILGMEKGMEFIQTIDGVEAVFMDSDGNVEVSDQNMNFTVY